VGQDADRAMLVLPLDLSGDYLVDKTLVIVPREQVLAVIQQAQIALDKLNQYIEQLLAPLTETPFLLLMGNLTDAEMTSFTQEVDMYEAIVRQHVPVGRHVFLKAHPLSVAPVATQVSERLRGDYTPVLLEHEFALYPIELWQTLVTACRTISISYSSISLTYLYQVPMIHALTDTLIQQYFKPEYHDFYQRFNTLYCQIFEQLPDWDGRSILQGAL